MSLTREAILAAADLDLTEVPAPEWGGVVFVRKFTLKERLDVLPRLAGEGDLTARLLALGLCDAAGTRLFALDDAEALAGKSGVLCQRLAMEVLKVNQLGKAAAEDLEKN